MADRLNPEEENLLQSALQTAFAPVTVPKQSVVPEQSAVPATLPEPAPETSAPARAEHEPESTEEVWKAEYDAHVAEWRRQSAEQRDRAEQERARWEELRKHEREEAKTRSDSGWESIGGSTSASVMIESASTSTRAVTDAGETEARETEPSIADVRVLVTGEAEGVLGKETLEILPEASQPHSSPDTETSRHEKWEDIHSSESLTSSYPSISYPSGLPSPPGSHPAHSHAHHQSHHHAHAQHAHHTASDAGALISTAGAPPVTLTRALFDSSLPFNTRVLALLGSLAINVALPFVNGVMLGFGEIFAKEVLVGWFGFGRTRRDRPGAAQANVGLRSRT
ncbi:uncharacterized protein FIBRA_07193 [Fibroporia radiculosa]|uniref:Uncharacterized protein n=1 Tax=Fibroporia radiculosa TaxID=599839 RepID=J4GUH7_9APHY|nr:uncharacterized protein FIBRA_07193 [Fibroporia radiculosa]CCM04995.1 predicted protein [Fibroporia radiculosa]